MPSSIYKKYIPFILISVDLITNLLPVMGLFLLEWKIFSVMFLYWVDTLVFFLIFLNWFVFASERKFAGKFFLSLLKLFTFATFVFIQTYCIFIFTGQFYLSQENISENIVSNMNVTIWDVVAEMWFYMSNLTPIFLVEEPLLVFVIIIFILNHIFVFAFPDRDAMYEGFRTFFLRIAFPTFSILTISIVAAVALIISANKLVTDIAFYTALTFILLKIYYDIKRIVVREKYEKETELQKDGEIIILEEHGAE